MSGFDILGPQTYKPAITPIERRPFVEPDGPRIDDDEQKASGFADKLADALGEVNSLGDEVKSKAEAIARGEDVELHDLMVSMGKSDVAFNMMLEVRNKLLEAWNTLSRAV